MTRVELLAKAKPILFNTEMVRAILDGRKTVTRRVIKGDTDAILNSPYHNQHPEIPDSQIIGKLCLPPYEVGDILYVRETWCKYSRLEDDMVTPIQGTEQYYYRADGKNSTSFNTFLVQRDGYDEYSDYPKWHPSIHMPKEAARIFLRVTGLRVERLQDITKKEALKEGISDEPLIEGGSEKFHALWQFPHIWDSTIPNKNRELYGWDANPWVWVIKFEKLEV